MTLLALLTLQALAVTAAAPPAGPIVITPNEAPLLVAVEVRALGGDRGVEQELAEALRQAIELSPPLAVAASPGQADRVVRLSIERSAAGMRGVLAISRTDGLPSAVERLEGPGSARALALAAADRLRARELGLAPLFVTRLAAVRRSPDGGSEVVTLDPLGGGLRAPRRDGLMVASPRWQPDGRAILYTSWRRHPEIWTLDPATGEARPVVALGTLATDAAPAPGGAALAFTSVVGGNSDLYRLDPGQSAPVRLTEGPAADALPSWTPDGAELVFQSSRAGSAQLHAMAAGGGEARRLTFAPGREFTEPAVHPLGDRVAAAVRERGGGFRIQVIPFTSPSPGQPRFLDTRAAVVVDSPAGCEGTEPAWSPEGELLVFTETCAGRPQLVVTTPDGARRVKIGGGSLESAAWGPRTLR